MTAHIVGRTERSNVPGHLVRRCTRVDCPWEEHHPDRDVLDQLARDHHNNPNGNTQ